MKGCVQWYPLAIEKISPGAGLELPTSKIQIKINLMFYKHAVTPTCLPSHICYRNRDWNKDVSWFICKILKPQEDTCEI